MAKKNMKHVDFDLNMSVSVLKELPQNVAYWCVPGYQKNGLKPGFTSYIWADHTGFKLPHIIKFVIDYPFDEPYKSEASLIRETRWKTRDGEERIEAFRADSIGDIVWHGAQAYVKAFQWAKDNDIGYWHGIGDLVFEGMTIYEDGTVEFSVGS